MPLLLVRQTVQLPPTPDGRIAPPGAVYYVDTDHEDVQGLLGEGYLVPVGEIPALDSEPTGDDVAPAPKPKTSSK